MGWPWPWDCGLGQLALALALALSVLALLTSLVKYQISIPMNNHLSPYERV